MNVNQCANSGSWVAHTTDGVSYTPHNKKTPAVAAKKRSTKDWSTVLNPTLLSHAWATPTHQPTTSPSQEGKTGGNENFRSSKTESERLWERQILRSGQNFETVGEKLLIAGDVHALVRSALLRSEAVGWSDEQGDRATRQ